MWACNVVLNPRGKRSLQYTRCAEPACAAATRDDQPKSCKNTKRGHPNLAPVTSRRSDLLTAKQRALTESYNARELMRRSVKVTSWIVHGLLDTDNVADVLKYEARFLRSLSVHAH